MMGTFNRNFNRGFNGDLVGSSGGVDTLESIAVTTAADVSNPTFVPVDATSRLQMKAVGTYSISGPADITALVTWSSTVVAAATIDTAFGADHGEVAAVSAWNGTSGATGYATTIQAALGAVTGSTTVTVDLARDGGIRWPANAFEAALIGLDLDHLWIFDEASGNLLDKIGSLNLTASGTMTRQAAVAGLTRVGVQTADGTSGSFTTTAGNGPNAATEDVQWTVIGDITATPAAVRHVMSIARGTGGVQGTRISTTPRTECTTTGGTVAGSINPVTPGLVGWCTTSLLNDPGADTITVETSLGDNISGTVVAFVDGSKGLLGVGVTPPAGVFTWGAASRAAKARTLTGAQIFQRMGLA